LGIPHDYGNLQGAGRRDSLAPAVTWLRAASGGEELALLNGWDKMDGKHGEITGFLGISWLWILDGFEHDLSMIYGPIGLIRSIGDYI